jgi:predicted enzyme related to lactoylglutathione lyase
VPTRLYSVVFDAADHRRLVRWWSEATGWPVGLEDDDEAELAAPAGSGIEWLTFVPVDDAKVGKNRVHLDLASSSLDEQAAIVERLLAAGGTRVDLGQEDVPWVVLADPEGNELCVLEPRERFAGRGAVAAVVMDATDPDALAPFWEAASGWSVVRRTERSVGLRSPGDGSPVLTLVRVGDAKVAKNRVHLDVAPFAGDDQRAEVDRLLALGARPADVGQGPDATWVVLTDPEGNEFCVLSPRD